MRGWAAAMAMFGLAAGQRVDPWDVPPLNYSDTPASDRFAGLMREVDAGGRTLEGDTPLEKLRSVLEALDVAESSQVLVFSKTSKQSRLIHPGNPRAVFFSENAYVGYVPGGSIEVIVEDPVLGPVFYFVRFGAAGRLEAARDTSECLTCHGTRHTGRVPGLLVRSVFPDADGDALKGLAGGFVGPGTPIEERWGGYYVTGRSSRPHLGNRVYERNGPLEPGNGELKDLGERVRLASYPRPTSDVVSLLVLEHQCHVHNLLTAAGTDYRRAFHLAKSQDPRGDPDRGEAGRVADEMATRIVGALLFEGEAALGEVTGDEAFQRDYASRFPRTATGESLADFLLRGRLFRNRCSCMVYSDAFRHLPPRVKRAVIARLRRVLTDGDETLAPHLERAEKLRVRAVLEETLPEWGG